MGDLDVGAVACGLGRAIGNKVYRSFSHISYFMHEFGILSLFLIEEDENASFEVCYRCSLKI